LKSLRLSEDENDRLDNASRYFSVSHRSKDLDNETPTLSSSCGVEDPKRKFAHDAYEICRCESLTSAFESW